MKVRRLDNNHDWTFGSGFANYATGSDAVRQCVQTILLSFRFNWFLDEDHGINWFAYFVKNPDVQIMEDDIKRHILDVEGVAELLDLQLQLNTITRQMIITVRYTDIYNATKTVITSVTNP
jgi:hypothetical protein